MSGVVELVDLEKRFGDVAAVDRISLRIEDGEFFSLLGPSGCGKTTTLRLIAGFERPDAGAIMIDGADQASIPPHKRPVNTVFQSYALFPHMTVARNVAFGLEMRGLRRAEVAARVEEMLALVKLTDLAQRRPAQLSGGQQQRVAIARALATRPRIIFADEPTGNLDSEHSHDVLALLRRFNRERGQTLLLVTHDAEVGAFCDRIIHMRDGLIQETA